jgi:hypothetical protein
MLAGRRFVDFASRGDLIDALPRPPRSHHGAPELLSPRMHVSQTPPGFAPSPICLLSRLASLKTQIQGDYSRKEVAAAPWRVATAAPICPAGIFGVPALTRYLPEISHERLIKT